MTTATLNQSLPVDRPNAPVQASPGLIHWRGAAAHALVSTRARSILGSCGPEVMVRLEELWNGIDASDRVGLMRALQSLRPGGEPLRLAVRTTGAGASPAQWVWIVIDTIARRLDAPCDIYAMVLPCASPDQAPNGAVPLVCYDGLTGRPNRLLFQDQVHLAVRRAARDRSLLAVLSLDVGLAGPAPDRALDLPERELLMRRVRQAVSVRIGRSLRAEDLAAASSAADSAESESAASCGAFAVLLPCIGEPQDAVRIAGRILASIAKPLQIDGQCLQLNLISGIALYPWDDQEAAGLLRCADAALTRAKETGVETPVFFSKPMDALAADRLALENSLRLALELQEFVLHFQQRVDGETRSVLSVEALIRWNDPARGLVLPRGFLDVAEQSRLILPIGNWVLEQACRQNRAWQDRGQTPVPVSVNVAGAQFRDPGFVAMVARALDASGLAARYLELEIAEAVLMTEASESIRILRALKDLGVRLAIDCFGTGFSSFAYLKDFPIDVLKIDRSFVHEATRHVRVAAVTGSIIDLGARLGLDVVAVGVESEEQRRFLLDQGCRQMQGYLFARPMLAQELPVGHESQRLSVAPVRRLVSLVLEAPQTLQ